MSRLISFAVATLIASSLPQMAVAENGKGHGDGPRAEQRGERGNGGERARGGERREAQPNRVARNDDDRRGPGRQDHRPDPRPQQRAEHRAEQRAEQRQADRREDRREDWRDGRPEPVRVIERQVVPDTARIVFRERVVDRRVIDGCPPGLARRDNGCLPPGLARQMDRARDYERYDRYRYVWNARDSYDYRYRDGYLYRMNPQGGLLGYVPVLGGALWAGNPWPAQYSYEPVPAYYSQYYGLPDRYSYRYADGVVYGVNPQNQAITQVAALMTGQNWAVGQPMPSGYEIYNVPYAYRTQYVDGPQSLYRYSDGYVYQVDPTTQLVQAVIQLLT